MYILWLLALGFAIGYWAGKKGTGGAESDLTNALDQRNSAWYDFLVNYKQKLKGETERKTIDDVLAKFRGHGITSSLAYPADDVQDEAQPDEPAAQIGNDADVYENHDWRTSRPVQASHAAATNASHSYHREVKQSEPLDNISLLLYFGAFLFVASMGLFVAFAGLAGVLRAALVITVMAVLYFGGLYLYDSQKRLKQVGLTFAAIGLAIAPLVGLALYNYVFDMQNGSLAWLLTSVLCAVMYSHALYRLRHPLISYLLIFVFLSLFESFISVANAPVHYFVWAMAISGMAFQALAKWKGFWPELQEPSANSSKVLLPVALVVSLSMVPQHGYGQLAVSLLLAAAFYGLSIVGQKEYVEENAVAAHVLFLAGVVSSVYNFQPVGTYIATTLIILAVTQAVLILLSWQSSLWYNFATVASFSALAGVVFGLRSSTVLVLSLLAVLLLNTVISIRQRRTDAFAVGAVSWVLLPLFFGQYYLTPHLPILTQGLVGAATFVPLMVLNIYLGKRRASAEWLDVSSAVCAAAVITVIVIGWLGSSWESFILASALAVLVMILGEFENPQEWAAVAGAIMIVPIVRGRLHMEAVQFLTATISAMFINIALSLRHRSDINRWLSTGLWLLLPISLGSGVLGSHWNAPLYGWAYLVVMAGLMVSRAIARGKLLVSAKVPLASYARTASSCYVVGYVIAAAAAASIALLMTDSPLVAALLLACVGIISTFAGYVIEDHDESGLLMPLTIQLILITVFKPYFPESHNLVWFVIASSISALGMYCLAYMLGGSGTKPTKPDLRWLSVRQSSHILLFTAPASLLVIGHTLWPMPVALAVAGIVTLIETWNVSQESREASGGIITAALMWFMYFNGIHNPQAYTHVLAALFAAYAYWRARLADKQGSESYIWAMLLTATLPLAMQALSGHAGDAYGWWLLLEEIGFMMLGMLIRNKVVTFWGLYVAVGAVLYQLRGLGWAMLALLALFIIGIAIYQTLKRTDNKS